MSKLRSLLRPKRLVLVCFSLLVIAYAVGYPFALRQQFPIEIRETAGTGESKFQPQTLSDWSAEQIASAVWLRGALTIRRAIYSRGLVFTFTTSGRVLGLTGTENNGPWE